VELVEMSDRGRDDLLSTATDRFERRLAEECGTLRSEIGALRVEVVTQSGEIRLDLTKQRQELSEQFGMFRAESAAKHSELLKWALVFWVGQVVALASIVAAFR
jgi:hypothetical protein